MFKHCLKFQSVPFISQSTQLIYGNCHVPPPHFGETDLDSRWLRPLSYSPTHLQLIPRILRLLQTPLLPVCSTFQPALLFEWRTDNQNRTHLLRVASKSLNIPSQIAFFFTEFNKNIWSNTKCTETFAHTTFIFMYFYFPICSVQ